MASGDGRKKYVNGTHPKGGVGKIRPNDDKLFS